MGSDVREPRRLALADLAHRRAEGGPDDRRLLGLMYFGDTGRRRCSRCTAGIEQLALACDGPLQLVAW